MLPEEVTKLIGKAGDIRTCIVERGAIYNYADAVDDLNPLYRDVEYARNSRYGSVIASPGFFGWPAGWTGAMPGFPAFIQEIGGVLAEAGYPRVLDGGMEYDFFCPVRAGDTLAALSKVVGITEKETKSGSMAFLVVETTYTNQNGDVVAKVRQTTIHR